MGSGVGTHLQELDSPAVALRQILNGAALKEASHLLRGVLVVAILNLGNLDRGITGQSVFNGNRQVNDFHSGYTPFDSAGGRCLRLIKIAISVPSLSNTLQAVATVRKSGYFH